ncbi:hypothetical protein A3G67_01105 [Candidatus Roizmanbacteria bacterium RIFCSPLOWO2_12_FULL_40_12]|uniref:Uncharacterized protein n=1 Tax=Candidatus Roizmanbacteria bacterium RIFCSPLOWO2_01_FULL_40_42 TaxID=1802066 RepID=A0A1F7J241_9BACT|nr:MAG: hypothetical protein A2779_00825 [Candidatus Roizmanbacteria bacterium RIFCSPHIGHO2_01_FULL_40_98]OGK27591.1 MAG: hypothetical protein A3C31_02350 [Candidatus Roizmanbacteria bacterium RIFCSPHIGHO2_02_FULL_40_53]OGK30373.1 MAG: hypothetical protein A2W49_00635 [Candidatus Roizmanbacteria bacterium RIFCSPHIGHO2_12_41_18]OGK36145.1 MAG: hypothetical protein A3E69_01145 [Candidatus Roizmanbacteria bacterium RIFCSPHIGHO2_12_FULL_40_130]OGK49671.1 MAG: hypothetical protein A3B50_03000 [Candi
MEKQSSGFHKKIFVVIFTCLGLSLFLFLSTNYFVSKLSFSPNILSLTQPVNSFFGFVEKNDGISITIREGGVTEDNPVNAKKLRYRVLVDEQTKIDPNLTVPYLFTKVSRPISTIDEIKVGDYVTAETQTDLRVQRKNEFRASKIVVFPLKNTIRGEIVDLTPDIISITGIPILAQGSPLGNNPKLGEKEGVFSIRLTPQTEISTSTFNHPDPAPVKIRYSLIDLKKGLTVLVYTEGNMQRRNEVHALLIDPGRL